MVQAWRLLLYDSQNGPTINSIGSAIMSPKTTTLGGAEAVKAQEGDSLTLTYSIHTFSVCESASEKGPSCSWLTRGPWNFCIPRPRWIKLFSVSIFHPSLITFFNFNLGYKHTCMQAALVFVHVPGYLGVETPGCIKNFLSSSISKQWKNNEFDQILQSAEIRPNCQKWIGKYCSLFYVDVTMTG